LNVLHKLIEFLLFMGFTVMVIIVVAQIITRFVFFYSLPWSEEASRYLFAWIIFLGVSFGVKEDSQISIDLIDSFIKGKSGRKVLAAFQYIIQLIACSVMLYQSALFVTAGGAGQRSPAMHLPMTYVYMCLVVGFALLLLELIIKLGYLLFSKKSIEGGVE